MMKKSIILLGMLMILLASKGTAGSDEDFPGILGIWNNDDGRAKIEIFDCGGHYCGRIAWLKEPDFPSDDKSGMAGTPLLDLRNPDPALRSRPLLGLQIMGGFDRVGQDVWDHGRIYDPESGKTYKGKITFESPHRLHLRGYVGIPLFGRTAVWTR